MMRGELLLNTLMKTLNKKKKGHADQPTVFCVNSVKESSTHQTQPVFGYFQT